MKIKSIKLKNFRGAKTEVSLEVNQQESVLLYGDNGTGKSSFLDAIEWFISDEVSHLSGEEIKKHEGLKHFSLGDEKESFVEIKFSSNIENRKKLLLQKSRFTTSFEKNNDSFEPILTKLQSERLWIRNNQLIDFIIHTKSERLSDISSIIGYDEVAKVHKTLKKSVSDLKKVIKDKNLDVNLASKKKVIFEKLKQTVNNKEQFYNAVNDQVSKIKPELTINNQEDLEEAIKKLREGINENEIKLRQSLEKIKNISAELLSNMDQITLDINSFLKELKGIKDDSEKLKNISLLKLYEEANKILASDHENDRCPLCLSEIKKEDLLEIISRKIESLNSLKTKISEINTSKATLLDKLKKIYQDIEVIEKEKINVPQTFEKKNIKLTKETMKEIKLIIDEIKKEFSNLDLNKVVWNKNNVIELLNKNINSTGKLLKTKESKEDSEKRIDLITDITTAKQSFDDLLKIKKEKALLENQCRTLENITSKFNSKKRQEMDKFLSEISKYLNEYYLFMNEDQRVDNIEIKTLDGRDDEFSGIILELSFHGKKIQSPKKFLSESRLNCLGLSLFLSSIKLFNKEANFFILDDVISSFDKNHRYRFAQLLQEKFSDYQIIVLTHERDWFELIASEVRGKNWHINSTSWNDEEGIQIKIPLITFREKIDKKIRDSETDGLGNLLRKYTENILKELCKNLDVQLPFRLNDYNENRTLNELYQHFKQRIEKKLDNSDINILKRLNLAKYIENKASHDSDFKESLSDLQAIYNDLKNFEDIFKCTEERCKKFISVHNINENYITCQCGNKKLNWQ